MATYGQDRAGPAAAARLGEVEHRAHPGRRRRRRRDQDGRGDAARRPAEDAARGRAHVAGRLVRRRGRAADRRGAPWRGRRPAPGRACPRSGSAAPTRTSSSNRARSRAAGRPRPGARRGPVGRCRRGAPRRSPSRPRGWRDVDGRRRSTSAGRWRPPAPRWRSAPSSSEPAPRTSAPASPTWPYAAARREDGPGRGVLFSGQGAQRAGMGQELYARVPGVRRGLRRGLRARSTSPVAGTRCATGDVAWTRPGSPSPRCSPSRSRCTGCSSRWGVRPEVLIGHSIGEIAAAYVAGVLVARRRVRAGRGARPADAGAAGAAARWSRSRPPRTRSRRCSPRRRLRIAAVNGPRSVVISGAEDAVEAVAAPSPSRAARPSGCASATRSTRR